MGPASPEVSPLGASEQQNNNNSSAVESSSGGGGGGAFTGYGDVGSGYPGSLGSPSTPTPRPSSSGGGGPVGDSALQSSLIGMSTAASAHAASYHHSMMTSPYGAAGGYGAAAAAACNMPMSNDINSYHDMTRAGSGGWYTASHAAADPRFTSEYCKHIHKKTIKTIKVQHVFIMLHLLNIPG